MSKIKLLTIAVIGLLVLNLGMVTFLLLRKPPHPQGSRLQMEERGPRNLIINRLHFDKNQVVEYEQLISRHQSAIRLLNDKIKSVKNDLYASLAEENFNGKDTIIALLTNLHQQVESTHYDHFAAIRKICTPNQRKDFDHLTQDLARFFSPQKKDDRPPRD